MINFLKIRLWLAGTFLFFTESFLAAQQVVIELSRFPENVISSQAFIVRQPVPVFIEAVGAMQEIKSWKHWNPMIAYGWILNADTREVIWVMNEHNVRRLPGSMNVAAHASLTLLPGKYEAYFSTFAQRIIRISRTSGQWGEMIRNFARLFTEEEIFYSDEQRADWRLRILTREDHQNRLERVSRFDPDSLTFVRLTGARDRDYMEKGFTLSRDMPVHIYCIGEGLNNKMYDLGWIVNDRTAERVWEMRYAETRHAGGADKNRLFSGMINLPAGNYIAIYMTDDSHSSEEWNMQPPYDPTRWGMELKAPNSRALTYIRDYRREKKKEIVTLVSVGNREYRSERFSVTRPVNLLIYAIGEGRNGRMFDYGWITDENTGARIWEMTFDKTRYAGGAEKNRLTEEILKLNPGNYQAHFITDDSHAYNEWNENPPYHELRWGLTISLIDNNDADAVRKNTDNDDASVLVKINKVRDNETITKTFRLSASSPVRIICLGEGKKGKMYDYGWIRNTTTGQTVWEMTYNITSEAGGSKKNRLYDGIIYLDAGQYEVTYISDDSHHFNEWNAPPPNQPEAWGITVRKVK